jgi:hypothetical protein
MYTDSKITMTDSLERILIEREVNAMRSAAAAAMWRAFASAVRRSWRAAGRIVGTLRRRAKEAGVDYAGG